MTWKLGVHAANAIMAMWQCIRMRTLQCFFGIQRSTMKHNLRTNTFVLILQHLESTSKPDLSKLIYCGHLLLDSQGEPGK